MDLAKARRFNQAKNYNPAIDEALANAFAVSVRDADQWTDVALKAAAHWQQARGLTADGMVGELTLKALNIPGSLVPRALPHNMADCAREFPELIFGIDKSIYQGKFEPDKVAAAGCKFVIHRATSNSIIDTVVREHLHLAHTSSGKFGQKLKHGFYHVPLMVTGTWGNMTATDPRKYAKASADIALLLGEVELGNWLDLEPDDSEMKKPPKRFSALVKAVGRKGAAEWVRIFFEELENRTGEGAGGYLSPRLAKEGGEELLRAWGGRPSWWALYLARPLWPRTWPPGLVEGWETGDIHQFRADDRPGIAGGRCPGIDGGIEACDLNVINPASPLAALFAA